MGKPSLLPPEPRPGPRKRRATSAQIAKTVTDKRPSPPGQPDQAEITLRLVLPRAVLERLSARTIREERKLEALVSECWVGRAANASSRPQQGRRGGGKCPASA
jgi:hypothetical protein